MPIEDQGAPTNSSPTLSPKVSSPPSSPPLSTTSSIAKAEDAKAKLRQKLNPVPNTVVFNFVGTDKEVNHIENDGLDMSNRRSKKANVRNYFYCLIACLCFKTFFLKFNARSHLRTRNWRTFITILLDRGMQKE